LDVFLHYGLVPEDVVKVIIARPQACAEARQAPQQVVRVVADMGYSHEVGGPSNCDGVILRVGSDMLRTDVDGDILCLEELLFGAGVDAARTVTGITEKKMIECDE